MSNYRILRLKRDERDNYDNDMYIVQKKRLFAGWKTLENFSDLASARKYLATVNPHYIPQEDEVFLECE